MAIRSLRALMFFLILFCSEAVFAHGWQLIDAGLTYTKTKDLHVFRIDPKQFRFQVVQSKDFKKTALSSKLLAERSKAVLVINGGFFDKDLKSLGLLVNNGKELNPKHATEWWHIFQMRKEKGTVVSQNFFNLNDETEMALQAGPRLIVKNQIPKLKFSLARRSGIGVHKSGDILLAISNESEMSLAAFATLLNKPESEGGFDVREALNLDGGSSSQLYIHWKNFTEEIVGLSFVPNGIGVFTDSSN